MMQIIFPSDNFKLSCLLSSICQFFFVLFQIIFITEYMSSGSLARFLQRTRKSGATLNLKVEYLTSLTERIQFENFLF